MDDEAVTVSLEEFRSHMQFDYTQNAEQIHFLFSQPIKQWLAKNMPDQYVILTETLKGERGTLGYMEYIKFIDKDSAMRFKLTWI